MKKLSPQEKLDHQRKAAREWMRRWRAESPDEVRAYKRELYVRSSKHREGMKKAALRRRLAAGEDGLRRRRETYQKNREAILLDRKKKWAAMTPEQRLDVNLKRYGITAADYAAMLTAQGNRCANPGCRTTAPGGKGWHVDHDHVTKKVRALLCALCNVALGAVHESEEKLVGLISYLRQHADSMGESVTLQ